MAVPLRQAMRVGTYVAKQRLRRNEKFALVLQLEPLYQCNLACAGCGRSFSTRTASSSAASRCSSASTRSGVRGAPMVSIAAASRWCTRRSIRSSPPWSHASATCTSAPTRSCSRRSSTCSRHRRTSRSSTSTGSENATTSRCAGPACSTRRSPRSRPPSGAASGSPPTRRSSTRRRDLDPRRPRLPQRRGRRRQHADLAGVRLREGPRPGPLAQRRAHPRALPRGLRRGPAQEVAAQPSPLFLDFLEGKVDFSCTAWGIPSYSVLGWQRPCYLMSDGYASSYKELIDTTPWEKYGRGRDERCGNCMAHCGYEPTAVVATSASLRKSLRAAKDSLRPRGTVPQLN